MKTISIYAVLALLLLVGCNSEPSLQKYFVENSENKDFIAVDVSPSILNVDASKLTADQAKALRSFDKMNILAFKRNDKNQAQFEAERSKVNAILKDKHGFMWFGTEDGLNRFDGQNFVAYHHNDRDSTSIGRGPVVAMTQGKTGKIWLRRPNAWDIRLSIRETKCRR